MDSLVIDKFGVGIQVFEGGHHLLTRQLLARFGIAHQLGGESQHLEIEVIGLLDRGHHRLLGGHHIVGLGLQVCIERLERLDSQDSSTQHKNFLFLLLSGDKGSKKSAKEEIVRRNKFFRENKPPIPPDSPNFFISLRD